MKRLKLETLQAFARNPIQFQTFLKNALRKQKTSPGNDDVGSIRLQLMRVPLENGWFYPEARVGARRCPEDSL